MHSSACVERARPGARRRSPRAGPARARRAARAGPQRRGRARSLAASGPQTTSGSRVSRREQQRELLRPTPRARRPAGAATRRSRAAGGRLGELAGSEQERGQPVGDLDRPVGERWPSASAVEQPDRAGRDSGAAGSKHSSTSAALDAVVGQQVRRRAAGWRACGSRRRGGRRTGGRNAGCSSGAAHSASTAASSASSPSRAAASASREPRRRGSWPRAPRCDSATACSSEM